jgi:hypothetical protein
LFSGSLLSVDIEPRGIFSITQQGTLDKKQKNGMKGPLLLQNL